MTTELEIKTERLRAMLAAEDLGGVLINAQHNFAWLTGGGTNGIDLSRSNGSCFVFVHADGRRFLIANNIEMPRLLEEEICECDFEPVELSWQAEKASVQTVLNAANSLLVGGTSLATDLCLSHDLRVIEAQISPCRHQLTEPEIERYRRLGSEAGEVLRDTIADISPGETENEIAAKVRSKLLSAGIIPVVTLVGADERIVRYRHPVPTENVWRKTLLIAVCARRHGLIACLSRIICADEIPCDLQRRTEIAAKINATLYAGTRPGVTGSEIYGVAASAYADFGFAEAIDKHHQGGATGYRTRDWTAHPSSCETVKMHQAFAWNPSITGTKTEETGIVTPEGFEIITATPGFPKIDVVVDGREYSSPGILSLTKGASA